MSNEVKGRNVMFVYSLQFLFLKKKNIGRLYVDNYSFLAENRYEMTVSSSFLLHKIWWTKWSLCFCFYKREKKSDLLFCWRFILQHFCPFLICKNMGGPNKLAEKKKNKKKIRVTFLWTVHSHFSTWISNSENLLWYQQLHRYTDT